MKERKFTAADRPQFRRDVAKTMEALGVEVVHEAPSPDAVIICARAEDFDPSSNVLWELEANRSAVRDDIHCVVCESAVAMSHDMYRKYSGMDKKLRVCCAHCLASLAAKAQ